MPNKSKTPTGAELIAAERQRQKNEEGYSDSHDDSHEKEEMALAAAAYALPGHVAQFEIWDAALDDRLWPWPGEYKPERSRVRNLVKAGALLAAEIDRLQRIEAKGPSR